jgi:hypothetical protein
MAKSNLNNALNDWFSEDQKPEIEQISIDMPTSVKTKGADKTDVKLSETKKEENKISRNIETKNISNPENKVNTYRVKFGTMIRADLLKKLKVKSVQDDKSIYELIENAIEKLVK